MSGMTSTLRSEPPEVGAPRTSPAWEVFRVFLRLGCTSFGGPIAHLGYFRAAFVERRQWLDEPTYADIVALCQFLPGPASSQVAVSLGILRAGLPGGLAAWLGFTLPSAIALIFFAYGIGHGGAAGAGVPAWLHGLMIVAVAVVAQAVYGMARTLCPDRSRATLMVAAAAIMLLMPGAWTQIGVLLLGAVIGAIAMRQPVVAVPGCLTFGLSRMLAAMSLVSFVALLFLLPLAATQNHVLDLVARFYRAGALVFGGGHVVLPLLQQAVVPPGWIDDGRFLAGYGAAQAVPGPLFTFAAYLGAAMGPRPNGVLGGVLCLIAIYVPSLLLLIGVLPFWDGLRRRAGVQAVLRGVNAAVVGVLLAALYTPVWTSAVRRPADVAIAFVAFLLLVIWRIPAWAVVILGAATAAIIA
jgi:chromate transporter